MLVPCVVTAYDKNGVEVLRVETDAILKPFLQILQTENPSVVRVVLDYALPTQG